MGLQESFIDAHDDKHEGHVSRRSEPHAYASEAGQCARKIALRLIHSHEPRGPIPQDRIRLTGVLASVIGEAVHEVTQTAIVKAFRDAGIEIEFDLDKTTGRADATYRTQDGKLVVVEIKTKSPKAFKTFKDTNAPDFDNVLQAVLGAIALGAQYVHIIYINKAATYFENPLKEWIFPLDDELEEAGLLEEQRLATIVALAEARTIPEPVYHGEVLANPDEHFWPCGFCPFKDECRILGPERQTLITLETITFTADVENAYLDALSHMEEERAA